MSQPILLLQYWRQISQKTRFFSQSRPVFNFEKLLNGKRYQRAVLTTWKFSLFGIIWLWFHENILIRLWIRVFWKKVSKNQDFSLVRNCEFSALFWFFEKCPSLTSCNSQTIWSTVNHGVSMERYCPNLSFGTHWLFVWPLVWSQ